MVKLSSDPDAESMGEQDVGICAYRSAAQPCGHPSGIFQARFADFFVRELGRSGEPCRLTELPRTAPESCEILEFVLYKENRTTADALQQLSGASGIPVSAFSVAGSKDRRAVTVQEVTAAQVREPARLLRINEKWVNGGSRVRVGHFRPASQRLGLSQSRGNRFVVVLRNASLEARTGGDDAARPAAGPAVESEEERLRLACDRAVSSLSARGFVNYFGMQRFGNAACLPTHAVGAALLRRQFVQTLKSVLHPKQAGLKPAVAAAYDTFHASTDAKAALRKLPHRGCALAYRMLTAFDKGVTTREDGGSCGGGSVEGKLVKGGGGGGGSVDTIQGAAGTAGAAGATCAVGAAGGAGAVGAAGAAAAAAAASAAQHQTPTVTTHAPMTSPSTLPTLDAAQLPTLEAAAVEALRCLPRRQLLLYANSLQALAWNRAATFRLQRLDGGRPIEGDLVWREKEQTESAQHSERGLPSEPLAAERADGVPIVEPAAMAADAEGMEPLAVDVEVAAAAGEAGPGDATLGILPPSAEATFGRAAAPPAVHPLTAAEAASGKYSLADVLLPLPGHSVAYPRHAAVEEYARVLSSCGLECKRVAAAVAAVAAAARAPSGEGGGEGGSEGGDEVGGEGGDEGGGKGGDEAGLWYCPGVFDLPGGYRPLVAFASDLTSSVISYTDYTAPLEAMDADLLDAAAAGEAPPAPKRQRLEPTPDAHADACADADKTGALPHALPPASPPTQRWAWRLEFSLPASVYATMLLREVLHEPLDLQEHARRSKALLAKQPIVRGQR